MNRVILLVLVALAIAGFTSPLTTISLEDSRDGKIYKTIKMGKLTVMAENLAYNAKGASCYKNQERFCAPYGRLYDYKTAIGESTSLVTKGICPDGWHIPNKEEWTYLLKGLNGKVISQKGKISYLVEKDPLHLQFGGFRSHYDKRFYQAGMRGLYMTSDTETGLWTTVELRRKGDNYKLQIHNKTQKAKAISCRCIKDY